MAELLLRGTELGAIDAVLFDKDGTLSISEPQLLTLAEARVFLCLELVSSERREPLKDLLQRAYGLRADSVCPAGITAVASRDHNLIATATALVQVGLGWPEALALSERVFAEADAVDARRSTDAPLPTSATTEGLLPWLEQLRLAGVRCAVISNDDMAGIEHFLRAHGLRDYFCGLWSAEHRPRKPDPAAVHGLCAELGVEPRRCALIGDANSDLRMAVAAGIPHPLALGYTAAWRTPPPLAEPHPLVHAWSELSVRRSPKLAPTH
ncbi:MAG: HAD-IA family hydrolase [Cyanobacteria bacterium]|jgi:phosphoglycolate phosphatase|uniref:HAD family hydrolase n=1 Tax=Synechococcaceae TaxID=1890426 RepID=UPI0002002F3E|nr:MULTISPECIES: HAD-IA family hydrolase [Synechococcaceae]MDA0726992.1 HAD-IA family hydrolase [Cyanobacteriota bacterium]MDA0964435.1 HAD-IA family hydrolase [Cyanobacteriota bacterium]MDA1155905.1 HAD-IA family hydrolase [Cyanobacteriota bacterium]NCV92015.1 HAD family hydrolase [Synechococcaceae bacterium WB7_3xG_012]